MRLRLKHVLVALVVTLLATFAYSPLLSSGLLASDIAVLVRGRVDLGLAPFVTDGIAKPLARLSVELDRFLFGLPDPEASGPVAFLARAENFAWLLLGAFALGRFARRLLVPWSGSEQARAAARAATLLFVLHPLAVMAVADLRARGDLIGLALSLASAAAFLRGRQDRRYAATVAALFLAILAGLASDLALGLPLLLAVAELTSSHRYRPFQVRLRTSFTTLVIFGAGASIDRAFHVFQLGSDGLPQFVTAFTRLGEGTSIGSVGLVAVEKLGFLVLPANPGVLGVAGVVLAGALFLLAIQPALVAARSAPRLWGWQLVVWFVALLVSFLLHAHVRVSGDTFGLARVLLPSAAVMAVGLGITTTAISGSRGPYVAWAVALGYAIVAHANALPWREASLETAALALDLGSARESYPETPLLCLDPPPTRDGVVPVGEAIDFLTHPALTGEAGEAGATLPDVRGLSESAFLALVLEPEFEELSRGGVVVVYPRASDATGEGDADGRLVRRLAPPRATTGTRLWRGSLNSPQLDLDCLGESALRVTTPAGVDPADLRFVSWRTRGDEPPTKGSIEGAWWKVGEEHVGVFDFSASLDWRLGGRVRTLVFEQGTQSIATAELGAQLPPLGAAEPRTRGEDWVFARPATASLPDGGRFVLGVLDLSRLSFTELDGIETGDSVRVPGAAALMTAWRSSRPIAWSLDYRIGPHTVARTRGRR